MHTAIHRAIEWELLSDRHHVEADPNFRLSAEVTDPSGRNESRSFYWAGLNRWVLRASFVHPGVHLIRSVASDTDDRGVHNQSIAIHVEPTPADERNPLFKHGPIRLNDRRDGFSHHDGKPFFWFGDTWWMVMSDRIQFPDDYDRLVSDRARKGFSVVQTCLGFPPDSTPFKDGVENNEGGPPWTCNFASINPAYFDRVDLRLRRLIDEGITPLIMSGWGYHLGFMGESKMRRHWSYLLARYSAWPVMLCLAGETAMRYYLSTRSVEEDVAELKSSWSRIAQHVRSNNVYGRIITTHPRSASWHDLNEPETLDFHMTQSGHMPHANSFSLELIAKAPPDKPVVQGEPPYENHGGTNGPEVQRFAFWSAILSGYKGFTYGAAGLFAANDRQRPVARRPDGGIFDRWTWDQALSFPGAQQLACAVKWLRTLPFDQWILMPDAITVPLRWGHEQYRPPFRTYTAGIPGQMYISYIPLRWYHWDGPTVTGLTPGKTYRATYFDPTDMTPTNVGEFVASPDGTWIGPITPYLNDWVVYIRNHPLDEQHT